MLNAIVQKLHLVKHVQIFLDMFKFFGGLDVIVINDFCQALPVRDKWIFQKID
jgi:hypothetical protein